jgi:hypothetical protein
MRLLVLLLALLMSASAENALGWPYAEHELDAATRAGVASLIAIAVYVLSVLQQPRPKRPAWDVALARALLTGLFALVAVLAVRQVSSSLVAEWLTAAVIGSEGPRAVEWLRERFLLLWKGGDSK